MQTCVTGVTVDISDIDAASSRIIQAAKEKRSLGIALLAVHSMVTALKDKQFRFRVNQLDLRLADGIPVVVAARVFSKHNVYQVRGHDLMRSVLKKAGENNLSVFLFGGKIEALEILQDVIPQRFPGLRIAGVKPGMYRRLSDEECRQNLDLIKQTGCDIVFVGLGSPRQETWIYENLAELGCPALGVGASFDYEAGLLKTPPARMKTLGLEWLWRLYLDPGRLWRRYLIAAPTFLVYALLQLAGIFKVDNGEEPSTRMNYG